MRGSLETLAAGTLVAGALTTGCADQIHDAPIHEASAQAAHIRPKECDPRVQIGEYGVTLVYNPDNIQHGQLVGLSGGIPRARQALADPYRKISPDQKCTNRRAFYEDENKALKDMRAWLKGYEDPKEAREVVSYGDGKTQKIDWSRQLLLGSPVTKYGHMDPMALGDLADGKTVESGIAAVRNAFPDDLARAFAISYCAMDAGAVCGSVTTELRADKPDEMDVDYLSHRFAAYNVVWFVSNDNSSRITAPRDQKAVCDRAFALCLNGTAKDPQNSQAAKHAAGR